MRRDPTEIIIVIGEDGNISEVYSLGQLVTVYQLDFGTGEEEPFEQSWDTKIIQGESPEQLITRLKEEHG